MNAVQSQSMSIPQDGYDWHVERWTRTPGPTDRRPTALLLHGTGASTHSWANLAPALADTLDLIAIDLPGHGRTGTPDTADLSLPGIAGAIASLLKSLNSSPRWAIGHSAGAAIAAQLHLHEALAFERIVSLNGAWLPLGGVAGWLFSPLARLGASTTWLPRLFAYRAGDPRQVRRLLESTGSRVDSATLAGYEALFSNPKHVSGVLRMMANWRLDALQAELPHLDATVHLIAGDNDRTIPLRHSRQLERLLPNVQLSIIERLGHLAHEEAAHTVAALIVNTWQRANDQRDATHQHAGSIELATTQAFTSTIGTASS